MELSHTFAINCIAREPFHLFICFHDGFSVGDRQPLWPRYPYPDRLLQFTGPLFLLAKADRVHALLFFDRPSKFRDISGSRASVDPVMASSMCRATRSAAATSALSIL